MNNIESLREFVEEVLTKQSEIGIINYFKIGQTKGAVGKNYPTSPFNFQITFDIKSKRGRKTLRKFAALFDQLEGVEWETWSTSINVGKVIFNPEDGKIAGFTEEDLDSKR